MSSSLHRKRRIPFSRPLPQPAVPRVIAAALAGVLLTLGYLPALTAAAQETAPAATPYEISFGRTHVDWSDGWRKLSLKARGKVTFSEDDTAILHLSPRSWVKVRERRGVGIRSVTIEPDGQGSPKYRYYFLGVPRKFDEEAQEWLAEALPDVIHNTGLGAETRARQLLAEKGAPGVLEKVSTIESDSTQAIYYRVLVAEADLDGPTLRRVMEQIGEEVESDYHRASILAQVLEHADPQEVADAAFFPVVEAMDSDHYRHQILMRLLDSGELSPRVLTSVAEAGAHMDSDHYRAGLLVRLARHPLDRQGAAAYLRTVDRIDSIHYQGRALTALAESVESYAAGDEALVGALRAAGSMDSDHYRQQFLSQLAPLVARRPVLRDPYFQAVAGIRSDHHRQGALVAVLGSEPPDEETAAAVFLSARGLSSDHYKSELLLRLAPTLPNDEVTLMGFLDSAATLRSDHYLGQVLEAFLKRTALSDEILRRTLEVAQNKIRAAHYRGKIVATISDRLVKS